MIRKIYTYTFGFILLSQLFLVARDMVVASHFGVSLELNHFLVGIIIPTMLIGFAGSVGSAILVPLFIGGKKELRREITQGLTLAWLMILTGLGLLWFWGSGEFQTAYLYGIYTFASIGAMTGRITLNSKGKYYFPAIAQTLALGLSIPIIFQLEPNEISLLKAYLAAASLEFLMILIALIRTRLISMTSPFGNAVRSLKFLKDQTGQAMAVLGAGFFSSLNPVVDQFFAKQLGPVALTRMTYSLKIPALAIGVIGTTIGAVFLTEVAKKVQSSNFGIRSISKELISSAVLGLGISLILTLLSQVMIQVAFGRGRFRAEEVQLVADLQKIFAWYIAPYLVGLCFVKTLNALGKNRGILWISALGLVVNFVLDTALAPIYGLAGIGLSTIGLYLFTCLTLGIFVVRESRRRNGHSTS